MHPLEAVEGVVLAQPDGDGAVRMLLNLDIGRHPSARAVVLGCTEIPLGIQAGPWQSLGVPLIDTIDALARASIVWARSEAR